MTSTLSPGARIWRGGVPTLLPGTGFQGGGEVGDAGSDPYVAPPSEDYTDVRMVDTAWTSLFDVHKDDLRLGAETARREGYSGIPDMKPYEMNRYWESPEGLRNAGAEMYSRILHSEDPSKYTLSRAMMLDDDDLAKIRVGEPYSLPLSSFGSEDFATRYLYPDESLMFESAEREGKNIPVMLKLLKGAKTTSVAEEGLSGRIGPPLESVTLGNFDVVSIKDVDRGGGHKYKEITIRQKDIGPVPTEVGNAGAIPKDDLIKESLKGINERGGITIDLAGHQPGEGYGYAPSKTTEKMFEAGTITPEDVDAYIDSHFEELQREGMHFGAWVAEDTKDVYLDVSKVGAANAETLRAAMEAEQLAVWDFGAPIELGELNIGRIDEQGKYHRLGKASDLHAEHARQVQRAIESRSAGSTSEVPGRPAAGELAVEKPASKAKPLKEKALKEGRGRTRAAGPGSARKPPTAMETTTDVLGKAGRVLGPVATAAGDAFTAYGLVGQAAEQGQEEELAQGHVIAQGPKVLGIPTGKAFADPTFKNQQSTAGRSKVDIDYWLKHGKWPETSTGPESLIGDAGRQDGGLAPGSRIWRGAKGFETGGSDDDDPSLDDVVEGWQEHNWGPPGSFPDLVHHAAPRTPRAKREWLERTRGQNPYDPPRNFPPGGFGSPNTFPGRQTGGSPDLSFRVQHADGTVSRHSLDQSGPMAYAGPQIDMQPGDQFFIDGNYG